MTARTRRLGICSGLAVGLLAAACASTAPGKSASSSGHVTSLASTLGSVQAAGKAGSVQPKPPNPVEGSRLFRLALQQLEQRNTQQALKLFEQSAEADPTQAATYNNLGILYKQAGQLDKAIETYQQAIARQGVYPDAYYNLALAYRTAGQFKEAEDAYLKAITQNEQFADARYNLGVLYELYLAQPAKALEQYQAYLQLNGTHAKDVAIWAATLERRVPKLAAPAAPAQPSTAAPTTPQEGVTTP